jgi:hypothetical protein
MTSVGMALLIFSQTFGGALFLSFAQLIFSHSLKKGLAEYAPQADAPAIIAAGATSFRSIVSQQELPGVLEAYSKAIDDNFYLSAGCAVAAFAICWFMGWKKLSQKKPKKTEAEATKA